MKIYAASSWRNNYQQGVVAELRLWGHEVYDFKNPPARAGFGWEEIHTDWQKWTTDEYLMALEHPLAEAGFRSDFDAMEWADACVLILPCGRSAHLELGWFAGKGKPTAIYSPEPMEPELMVKMCDLVTGDLHQVRDWLSMVEVELPIYPQY